MRVGDSKLGPWLDNLSDIIVDNVFLIAVGHGLGGIWQTFGICAALGACGSRW
ncbi:MAG: hypothetical protein ABI591_30490 [Kofleriaceae bacterium]